MLVNVLHKAATGWESFTRRDLDLLAAVVLETTQKAAEIAREYSAQAADAIIDRGMHP